MIGTLVERQTRYVKLLHLPSRDSQTLYAALVAGMGHLPEGLRKTLTWDQGTEMASHLDVSPATRPLSDSTCFVSTFNYSHTKDP